MLTSPISALTSSQVTNYAEYLKGDYFDDIKESDGLIRDFGSTKSEINNEPATISLRFKAYYFSRLYLIATTCFDSWDKQASLKLSIENNQVTEEFNVMTNPGRNYHAFKPIAQTRNINDTGVVLNDRQPLPEDNIESHLLDNDGLNDVNRELPLPPPLLTLEYVQALYKGLAQILRNEVLSHQLELQTV